MSRKLSKNKLTTEFASFKEALRKYTRKILNTESVRKKAANITGYEFSYISAALNQRNKGSFEFWFKILYYCSSLKSENIDEKIKTFFLLQDPFESFGDVRESDMIFKNLSSIDIVNEDTKYRLVTTLKDMLMNMNDQVAQEVAKSKIKKSSKI